MRSRQSIHFVGIGGAGMSGIAEVLLNLGYRVSGSDLKASDATRRLQRLGARVRIGHRAENLPESVDLVVVSNAVPDTNVELVAARDRRLAVMPRAQVLNDLMRLKQGLAIAGTHGKTTTTSMVAWILAQAGWDPTMVIGGILNNINQGARRGRGEHFVVEACEAFSSFLHLFPVAVAVTNVDDDHLENYGSRSALDEAFLTFINRVPFWGFAVLNADDPGIRALLPRITSRKITFGFGSEAELRAEALVVENRRQSFLLVRRGRRLGRIQLNQPGRFNVSNALAAAGMALELGIPFATIQSALAGFTGVRRRFERVGEVQGAWVVDDYAHHPTEVAATLTAARSLNPGRLLAVFQPHLFSRTQRLYREFARALLLADRIYLADIYPARERPMPGVTAQLIADQLRLEGRPADAGPASLAVLQKKIKADLRQGDMVITLGAGDVWQLGRALVAAKKKRRKK
jgi:UDP-N-acetylmuramate--alanine ligase